MTTVAEIVERRELKEVLHFTTNRGLTGILAKGAVLPRARLSKDEYLEHVYQPNADTRKDRAWLDYVNLSITRINAEYFGHSSRWHADEDVVVCAGLRPRRSLRRRCLLRNHEQHLLRLQKGPRA